MIHYVTSTLVNIVLLLPRLFRALVARLRSFAVIRYDIEGDVVYLRPPRSLLGRYLSRSRTAVVLHDVDREWTALAANPRVKAVILVLRNVSGGFVAASALHERILKLRESKAVVLFAPQLGNRDVIVASAASTVVLPPAGSVQLTGLAVEATNMRALLGRASVRLDVQVAGRYKGAPERLTRDAVSEPQREVLDAILDSWFSDFASRIANGRSRTVDEVRAWIDRGPMSAETAKELGLVDAIAFEHELPKIIDAERPPKAIERARVGSPRPPAIWPLPRRARIAVVSLKGLMHMDASRHFPWRTTGERTLTRELERAREDRRVRGVVLAIDSGGGSALASDMIWGEVMRVRAEKPIVAWMGNYAASGGYYAACACNEVVASPFTLTGSIGVVEGRLVVADLYRRFGITRTLFGRGRLARLGAAGRPFDDETAAIVRAEVTETYKRFIARVAEGRAMPAERVAALAEGRVYTGRAARDAGLVDTLGDITVALDRARSLADAPNAEPVVVAGAAGPLRRGDAVSVWADGFFGGHGPLAVAMATATGLLDDGPLALAPFWDVV